MNVNRWATKPTVYSGAKAFTRFSQLEGEKICFICDPYLKESDSLKKILPYINESNERFFYTDIVPDPPVANVVKGIQKMNQVKPTVLIAVGGGSAIDTAKAMRFFYEKLNQVRLNRFYAIPTTSGTGSEVTSAAVITDPVAQIKYPIFHEDVVPDEALLDAHFVLSCPPSVTAYSGLDALTHALESVVSRGRTIYTDALAEKAIETVFTCLETCVKDGNNLKARTQMHEASCLAGLAFDAAGLGVCHAIAHQIGALFHVPHGLANAILLPKIILANSQKIEVKKIYASIAKKNALCPSGLPDDIAVGNLISTIQKLTKACQCPTTLKHFGIDVEKAYEKSELVAKNARKDATFATNPIAFSTNEIKKIYQSIIE